MNKIYLILISILLVFSLTDCLNSNGNCDPTMYCQPVPYDSGWVDVRITQNGSNPTSIIIYNGYLEDRDTIGVYSTLDEEINFYLPIGNRYACEAYYSVGLQTIIALDGGRLRQRSEVNCDETCYKESNLNLDLRKL
mgnify:CR=1 FL=1